MIKWILLITNSSSLQSWAACPLISSSNLGQCHASWGKKSIIFFSYCLMFFGVFFQIYFYTFEVLQAAGFEERMASYMTLSIGLSELVAAVVCVSLISRGAHFALQHGHWCDFCPSELHHRAAGQESAPKRRLLDHGFTASCYHCDSDPTGKEILLPADCSAHSISDLKLTGRTMLLRKESEV